MAIGACGSSSDIGYAGSGGTTSSGSSGWTSEESSYADDVVSDTDVMAASFSDFGERVGNWPYSEDDTYALATDCATWQSTYDKYKDMASPSDRFATMHDDWVSGLGCYSEAGDLFARGVDNFDSSLIDAADAKINEGLDYISQASDELSRIQSE